VARTLGAQALGNAAQALEEACKEHDAALLDTCLAGLIEELGRMAEVLATCPELS
jgi:HPt (histidine-containing phosphotransfer) domain-containing protein